MDGHEDVFSGNYVVLTGTDVGSPQCKSPGKTVMGNNSYFTPTGDINECGKSLRDWQKAGDNEPGSTVAKTPSDEAIIGVASARLGIH